VNDPPVAPLDIPAILRVLDAHQVDYLLIGGLAVAAHGFPRGTTDVDITAGPVHDNLTRLAAALQELDATLRDVGGLDHDLSPTNPDDLALGGNWTLTTRHGNLDVFADPRGAAPYDQLHTRSHVAHIDGLKIRVVGVDDLIAMKLAAGREKDLKDLVALGRARPELGLDAATLGRSVARAGYPAPPAPSSVTAPEASRGRKLWHKIRRRPRGQSS
jgi:hypothetical protein